MEISAFQLQQLQGQSKMAMELERVKQELENQKIIIRKLREENEALRKQLHYCKCDPLILPTGMDTSDDPIKEREDRLVGVEENNKEEVADGEVRGYDQDEEAKEIEVKTSREEREQLMLELVKIKRAFCINKGLSYGNKEIAEISDSIPSDPSAVIVINNFMNSSLVKSNSYLIGRTHTASQPTISPGMSEIFQIEKKYGVFLTGAVSFDFKERAVKLIVGYEVQRKGKVRICVAIAPKSAPIIYETLYFLWREDPKFKERMDIGHTSVDRPKDRGVLVKWGGVRAYAEYLPSSKSVVTVDVWSPAERITMFSECVKTSGVKVLDRNNEFYACCVAIDNRLKVDLNNRQNFTLFGTKLNHFPENKLTLKSFSKGFFLFSGHSDAEGLISFQIAGTDIRFAVAFWVKPNYQNYFALSFLPPDINLDAHLMKSLAEPSEWKTREDWRHGLARDGELRISIRNVNVEARMSVAARALIELIVEAI